MRKYLILVFFLMGNDFVSGQGLFSQRDTIHDTIKYVKGSLIFPILPGERNYLSGSFAEIRRNHFHGGLDIKTRQREGVPVHAVDNGYISRIQINRTGYGNLLFMRHPSGLTSWYAHLKSLNEPLQQFLRAEQYRRETFEVDLKLPRRKFRYRKGTVIAFSGNTGSSRGPHLHFELRDKYNNQYNGLLYRFDEIVDKVRPVIGGLAAKTFGDQSLINGGFGRFEFALDGNDRPFKTIRATGIIGLELNAYDLLSSNSNHTGIHRLELFVDSVKIFEHCIEKVDADYTRHINAHVDYISALRGRRDYQKLYAEDGNMLNTYFYSDSLFRGRFYINENRTYKIRIRASDAYNNETNSYFEIEGYVFEPQNIANDANISPGLSSKISLDVEENHLLIKTNRKHKSKNSILLFYPPKKFLAMVGTPVVAPKPSEKETGGGDDDEDFELGDAEVITDVTAPPFPLFRDTINAKGRPIVYAILENPNYVVNTQNIFFYDLRNGIPDSVSNHYTVRAVGIDKMISPDKKSYFSYRNIKIMFPKHTTHDTLYLEFTPVLKKKTKYVYEFNLNNKLTPIHTDFMIKIKLDTNDFKDMSKVGGYSTRGWGGYKYEETTVRGNSIMFKTRTLGKFKVLVDNTPPTISPVKNKTTKYLNFRIGDGLSGVKSYRPTIDGKWILMNEDGKTRSIYTNADDPNIPAHGEFVLEVTDNAGNVATYKKKF